jgi:hypothetical protein
VRKKRENRREGNRGTEREREIESERVCMCEREKFRESMYAKY